MLGMTPVDYPVQQAKLAEHSEYVKCHKNFKTMNDNF